ncbi:MAG: hypothetical protein M3Z64_05745 [Verrucomicrobiota bacterium]|nr:hypothetical protein [Verrucomicrobiota bacterium]
MKKLLLPALLFAFALGIRAADIPPEKELKPLVQSSLLSFNKSVQAKDFSGFYKDIAAIWQEQTTPEKLGALFKDFGDKEIDLAPIKKLEPVFSSPPSIDSDGVLVVKGYYPTTPARTIFQLKYLQEKDEWKLVGIKVDTKLD